MERQPEESTAEALQKYIERIRGKMEKAAADLDFEGAAEYRDRMIELKNMLRDEEVENSERSNTGTDTKKVHKNKRGKGSQS